MSLADGPDHESATSGAVVRRRKPPRPVIRPMSRARCIALLERSRVGRIAYTLHDRVDLEPIHFVLDGDWIYFRTSPGAKLAVLQHSPWVAFEVDEVAGEFDWASVVVHGTVYQVTPDGPPSLAAKYERATKLLERSAGEGGSADEAFMHRTAVIGIHVNAMTGRAASTGARDRTRPS